MKLDQEAIKATAQVLYRADALVHDLPPWDEYVEPTLGGRPNYKANAYVRARLAAEAYLAALSERGVKLMPRHPTDAMNDAFWRASSEYPRVIEGGCPRPSLMTYCYQAIFDAAEEPGK